MSSTDGHDEFKDLETIIWRSSLTRRVEDFKNLINQENNFEKYFGIEYLEKLTEKSNGLDAKLFKLITFYFFIMLLLYATQNLKGIELSFFGYNFKNLGHYKEFILFIAAIITPVSAMMASYKKFIDALINECLVKIAPDENIREFYKHQWIDSPSDGLLKKINVNEKVREHGFNMFLLGALILVLGLFLITLVLASFFIQIVVIYDVAVNPATDWYINKFVIFFALSSIVFSWLLLILQMPMPEVDYSNYEKISKLEKDEPEKYKAVISRIYKKKAKKDELANIIFSALIYLVVFSLVSYIWYGLVLGDIDAFLPKALLGSILVIVSSKELLEYFNRHSYRCFFKKYTESSSNRLEAFGRLQKFQFTLKVFVPALLTILYTQFTF
ncbi:hypothetical protein MJ923_07725 [Shewanella sp. 3B26]|uniref:Uncharacterized protein n=1 Tax=Shewanella zhuhaiensis TaxID=2919576 RepID=A0AAJ1BG53_9GAMM|nr:hypothetical protein [Shewanella zhuhaiensis]MCH4294192.1 hypothetical protein [Shewanella zhuhaiensis]